MIEEKVMDSVRPRIYDSIWNNQSPLPLDSVQADIEKLLFYAKQHRNVYNLKHIAEADAETAKTAARREAQRLSDLTGNQAYTKLTLSLISGGLTLLGVTQTEPMQRLLSGVAEAVKLVGYTVETKFDAKKSPLQTELNLITNSKLPEGERMARDYFEALSTLREALRRLAEMEKDTVSSIHRN